MPYDLKKLIAGVAAIGALGIGGSAIAGAATNNDKTPTAVEQSAESPGSEAAEAPGTEVDDGAEKGDRNEPETKVSAADQAKASEAALAAVGSGKVTEVSADTPDANEAADKPEKGDAPDPAYESNTAYEVEVTKADGSAVDVALDQSFSVLGTQAAEQDQGGDSEQGEQPEAAEMSPAK